MGYSTPYGSGVKIVNKKDKKMNSSTPIVSDNTLELKFKEGELIGFDRKPTINDILKGVQGLIDYGNKFVNDFEDGGIRDEYHSFEELYNIRLAYNVALFNEWGNMSKMKEIDHGIKGKEIAKYNVHKSWKHNDGEWCFGAQKKWFIVSAMLPTGLISNHYKAEYWDLFKIPSVERAEFEFDGHTALDVIDRLKKIDVND